MTSHPRVALGKAYSGPPDVGTQHPIIAVGINADDAMCVSLDKGWTFCRHWSDIEVEHEFVVYSPEFPQEQAGWRAVLRQITEAQSLADRWEEQCLDEEARRVDQRKTIEELQNNLSSHYKRLFEGVLPRLERLKEENDLLWQRVTELQNNLSSQYKHLYEDVLPRLDQLKEREENPPYVLSGFGAHPNPAVLVLEDKDIEDVEVKSIDDGRWWLADDALVNVPEFANEKEAREAAEEHLAQAAGAEAVARAIEKMREDRMGKVRIRNNQKDDDA